MKGGQLAEEFFDYLEREKGISKEDIEQTIQRKVSVPATIFEKDLGCMESIVKYLRENKNHTISEISAETGRAKSTISLTYKKAREKRPEKYEEGKTNYFFPVSRLKGEKSILGAVANHLTTNYGISTKEAAFMLERSYNAVWLTLKKFGEVKGE